MDIWKMKKGWVSNRFRTEADREAHTKMQFDAISGSDEAWIEAVTKEYGLDARVLTQHCIRITDGTKRLDLFKDRYFKVDIKERGDYSDWRKMVEEYFNLKAL